MTDYIKRSAAIRAVLHNEGQAAVAAVQEIKAEDVAPVVHAYWIEDIGLNGDPYYICSHCGDCFNTTDGDHPLAHGFDYCPKCGAKMDGKEQTDADN